MLLAIALASVGGHPGLTHCGVITCCQLRCSTTSCLPVCAQQLLQCPYQQELRCRQSNCSAGRE